MASFQDLTTAQLRQAVQIREQIESLQEKLDALLGGSSPVSSGTTTKTKAGNAKGKRTISPESRARMAAAQQARYAKLKTPEAPAKTVAKKSAPANAAPKKRTLSPETKAKLAAAMKARWAARKKGAPSLNAAKS